MKKANVNKPNEAFLNEGPWGPLLRADGRDGLDVRLEILARGQILHGF